MVFSLADYATALLHFARASFQYNNKAKYTVDNNNNPDIQAEGCNDQIHI